jgi:hypothetical protein
MFSQLDVGLAGDVGAHPRIDMSLAMGDTRLTALERSRYRLNLVAEAGDDAHSRDNNPRYHQNVSVELKRPTRRSLAV